MSTVCLNATPNFSFIYCLESKKDDTVLFCFVFVFWGEGGGSNQHCPWNFSTQVFVTCILKSVLKRSIKLRPCNIPCCGFHIYKILVWQRVENPRTWCSLTCQSLTNISRALYHQYIACIIPPKYRVYYIPNQIFLSYVPCYFSK